MTSERPATTETGQEEPSLGEYFYVLWRRWWVIVIILVLGAASAGLYVRLKPITYEARATILLQTDDPLPRLLGTISPSLDPRLQTYVRLLSSGEVVRQALPFIYPNGVNDAQSTIRDLQDNINASLTRDTNLIEVSYQSPDPAESERVISGLLKGLPEFLAKQREQIMDAALRAAQRLTPGTGEADKTLAQQVMELQTALDIMRSSGAGFSVQIVDPPVVDKVSAGLGRTLAFGGLLGAILGVLAAFGLEYMNRSIRTEDEVRRTTGLPVMGVIPLATPAHNPGLPTIVDAPKSPLAEAFRLLRANLEFTAVNRPWKTILVTSPGPREGKSLVALNLVQAFALQGKRTLLVDVDLRKPRLHRLLGVPREPGLTSALIGAVEASKVIIQTGNISFLPTGALPPNPAEILASDRMAEFLKWAAGEYDVVVLDGPPALGLADAVGLSKSVGAMLLVLRAEKTERDAATATVDLLRGVNANVVGVVLNGISTGRPRYYRYRYYRYYRYYHYGQKPEAPEDGGAELPGEKDAKT